MPKISRLEVKAGCRLQILLLIFLTSLTWLSFPVHLVPGVYLSTLFSLRLHSGLHSLHLQTSSSLSTRGWLRLGVHKDLTHILPSLMLASGISSLGNWHHCLLGHLSTLSPVSALSMVVSSDPSSLSLPELLQRLLPGFLTMHFPSPPSVTPYLSNKM